MNKQELINIYLEKIENLNFNVKIILTNTFNEIINNDVLFEKYFKYYTWLITNKNKNDYYITPPLAIIFKFVNQYKKLKESGKLNE